MFPRLYARGNKEEGQGMKIAIIGYSGSGKSTLAGKLGAVFQADVLHFDRVQFLPGWEIRAEEDKKEITREFLDTHESWVIDGNYSKLFFERRMEEADLIIMILFNRFSCLRRVVQRYRKYRNTTRPDMGVGCNEKLDWEFIKWVLYKQRTKQARSRYAQVYSRYKEKVIIVKNQRQLDECLEKLSGSGGVRQARETL